MSDEQHYPVKTGALGGRYVIAKLGTMRKARDWLVQATDDDRIIVQADGAIGVFDVSGANGRLCTQGGYFPHLAIAKPFEFPGEFVRTCVDVAHPLDAQTSDLGMIVEHTVRVIR